MEAALWIDGDIEAIPQGCDRIYWGHETAVGSDYSPSAIDALGQRMSDSGIALTMVTPFVTEAEIGEVFEAVEYLANRIGAFEVVCNDWGLFSWLAESKLVEPVIGRFLVGQATDPRLAVLDAPDRQKPHERTVLHADGTQVALRYRPPTKYLMDHLCECSIDVPEVLEFLSDFGARRLEVSNLLQGVKLNLSKGWRASLHLPEVPVAVARENWRDAGTQWLHASFPVALHRRENTVFYLNENEPQVPGSDRIDRLVYRSRVTTGAASELAVSNGVTKR